MGADDMTLDTKRKAAVKRDLASCLAHDKEIQRIVVFGSFNESDSPADMDVAVFQTSNEPYIPLAMKYRRQTRSISRLIPLDILPLRSGVTDSPFLKEIEKGETIFER